MEKSNMELIKEFIEICPLLKGNKINVDYLKENPLNYSIDRTPIEPVIERYINGSELRQIAFDFSVTAPISSQSLINLQNSEFCEEFMNWVWEKNKNKEFPKINGAYEIKCTSPGYLLKRTDTTAIYIIQMNFKYYKY